MDALPAFLASFLLALAALPSAAADVTGAQGPDAQADPNPCRPYPEDPALLDQAWCTAKGSVNATVILAENVWDGNYTTVQDYLDGLDGWQGQVVDCLRSLGDHPNCPNLAVARL